MTTETPIHQPAIEDLKNAAQIAWAWRDRTGNGDAESRAFGDIARFLKHALDKLSEPSEATVQRTALLSLGWNLKEHPNENIARKARDTAACVIDAQLRGWGPL